MTYIDDLAREIYDEAHPEDAGNLIDPQDWPLYRIYAVLCLAKGWGVSAPDVHDAWSAWMAAINPEHRSLIPSGDLSRETLAKDRPYVGAIRRVANRRQQ